MRLLVLLCLISAAIHVPGKIIKGKDACKHDIACNQTEYKEYLKCLGRKRAKRQICIDTITPQLFAQQVENKNATVSCKNVNCVSNCIQSCASKCSGMGCNDRCGNSCNEKKLAEPVTSNRIVPSISKETTEVVDPVSKFKIVPAVNQSVREIVEPIRRHEIVEPISNTVVIKPSIEIVPAKIVADNQTRITRYERPIKNIEPIHKYINLDTMYKPDPEMLVQPVQTVQNSTAFIQKESREIQVSSPNITTIIKLTNIVNNTNVVNVPTNINNTNVNNLNLGSNSSTEQQLSASNKKCCVVVQPKVCHKLDGSNGSEGGTRCIHRRHHTCGEQCSADTVHALVRQPCAGPPDSCPPSIAYIPQPQPRCSYQNTWPYVSCGNKPKSCGGCYDHYGYGFQQYHGVNKPACNGCYDDGFQSGSLYRQGPFYQPGYYHTPPTLNVQPSLKPCGSGCFGNERVDPAFGIPSYSPYGIFPFYSSPFSYFPQLYPQPPYVFQPQFIPQIPNMMPSLQSNLGIPGMMSPSQVPNPGDSNMMLLSQGFNTGVPNIMASHMNPSFSEDQKYPLGSNPPFFNSQSENDVPLVAHNNNDMFQQQQPSMPDGFPAPYNQPSYYPPSFFPPPIYPSQYYPPPSVYPLNNLYPGGAYPFTGIDQEHSTMMSNSTNTTETSGGVRLNSGSPANGTQHPMYLGFYPPPLPVLPPVYPPPYPLPYPAFPYPGSNPPNPFPFPELSQDHPPMIYPIDQTIMEKTSLKNNNDTLHLQDSMAK